MLRNPALYGIPVEARETDPKLEQWRANLVHTAAVQLEKSQLIKYDRKAGNFQTTELPDHPYKLDLFRVKELPTEVLSLVFSFLDMDSLKAARLVSR